jgi:hypothetical protein
MMDVYIEHLRSFGVIPYNTPMDYGIFNKYYKYSSVVDNRLSTLTYAIIIKYNIPTDKLPRSLSLKNNVKAVIITTTHIRYYETIGRTFRSENIIQAYIPASYNLTDNIAFYSGIIPISAIYVSTNIPVYLYPSVKYLLINNLYDTFNICIELEYLYITRIHAPVVTDKPIKFLFIADVSRNIILKLLPFVKYIIYSPIKLSYKVLQDMINSPVKNILISNIHSHIKEDKVIVLN